MRRLKYIVASAATVFCMSLVAAPASAQFDQTCKTPGAKNSSVCQKQPGDPLTGPNGVITRVTNIISLVAGIAAVIMIVIGGFMYVMSSGDAQRVEIAKNTVIYAVVGLIIIALARGLIVFVVGRL